MRAGGRSGTRRSRLALAAALSGSLLLHLLVISGGLPLAALWATDDDLISSRPLRELPRVRLVSRPPATLQEVEARAGLRVSLMAPPPPATAPAPATARPVAADDGAIPASSLPPAHRAPIASQPDLAPEASPPPVATPVVAPVMATSTVSPEAVAPSGAEEDLAPAFPVRLSARLAARIGDIDVPLQQDWWLEGYRYAISVSGRHLGVRLQATSEGSLAADGGLSPERSQTMVGGTVRGMTEVSAGMIRLGRPGQLREVALPLVVQDMMSLPFHLAVTFDGTARTHFVSSGHSVQQFRFLPVAEETLRLPAGRLRTLHLRGEYFHHRLREMTPLVDIWLALDYLNVPVKVSGHLADGQPFEYRLDALEIEGLVVLDSSRPELARDSDDAIPGWLQARQSQDLKNP